MADLESILFELGCETEDAGHKVPPCSVILVWCQRFPEHAEAIFRHCVWWYVSELPSALGDDP